MAHISCIPRLSFNCRPTFWDGDLRQYRENTDTSHHWVHRRSQTGKCQNCSKVSLCVRVHLIAVYLINREMKERIKTLLLVLVVPVEAVVRIQRDSGNLLFVVQGGVSQQGQLLQHGTIQGAVLAG